MSILYKSARIGKNGMPFLMFKFRTLKESTDKTNSFAGGDQYVFLGRFMRKFRMDEIPQIWNILRGDMSLCGPRPEEEKTFYLYPAHIREKLVSVKPGLVSLSALYFMHEEQLLHHSSDPHKDYWEKIKPMKLTLDFFYIENKCFSLDAWLLWQGFKLLVKQLFL